MGGGALQRVKVPSRSVLAGTHADPNTHEFPPVLVRRTALRMVETDGWWKPARGFGPGQEQRDWSASGSPHRSKPMAADHIPPLLTRLVAAPGSRAPVSGRRRWSRATTACRRERSAPRRDSGRPLWRRAMRLSHASSESAPRSQAGRRGRGLLGNLSGNRCPSIDRARGQPAVTAYRGSTPAVPHPSAAVRGRDLRRSGRAGKIGRAHV